MQEKDQQMEIPDIVRKLMIEHPELELFINVLLDQMKLYEKKNHELAKENRRLWKALNEIIGPSAMKWRDRPTYIRIRSIPKQNRKEKRSRANHKGVARPVPKEVDEVVPVTTGRCPSGHELGEPIG